jgi:hypothetical protein
MLSNNGYILFHNKLTNKELNFGLSCIQNDNKVDYVIMKKFIDNIFFPTIQKNIDVIKEPNYVKFRFSNNNNSTDASTFHADIYNHVGIELLPIYTCLCYFDDAQLEIIPGSHKYNNNGQSINTYKKKIILNIQRGDILVFHANMHHRGINYNKEANRRLLQVFEVFPDSETYNKHFSKLVIVQSSESFIIKKILSPIMYNTSKFPSIINFINFFHYILMYNDFQYKIAFIDIAPWDKKNRYITYEPGRRIFMENLEINNKIEDLNVNVLCNKNVNSIYCSNYYLYVFLLYSFIIVIIIYIINKFVNKKFVNKKFVNKKFVNEKIVNKIKFKKIKI